jgi:hypothetical protein
VCFLARSGAHAVTTLQQSRATLRDVEADLIWLGVLVFGGWGLPPLVALVTRSPVCPSCGVRATRVEEEELSALPLVLWVAYRCPRCGGLVARRSMSVGDH